MWDFFHQQLHWALLEHDYWKVLSYCFFQGFRMAQQDVGRCFCKVIHIKKCGMLSMNIAKLCRLLFAKKKCTFVYSNRYLILGGSSWSALIHTQKYGMSSWMVFCWTSKVSISPCRTWISLLNYRRWLLEAALIEVSWIHHVHKDWVTFWEWTNQSKI